MLEKLAVSLRMLLKALLKAPGPLGVEAKEKVARGISSGVLTSWGPHSGQKIRLWGQRW